MEENGKFGWFLAGAVIGAGAALLLAPKAGKEIRSSIGESTKDGREAIETGSRDLLDKGHDLYSRGKQIVEDAADLFERGRKLVQG